MLKEDEIWNELRDVGEEGKKGIDSENVRRDKVEEGKEIGDGNEKENEGW